MLRVLTYHRVMEPTAEKPAPNPSLVSATADVFDREMRELARRYRVVSLDEVLVALEGGRSLPARAVLLTFDDAYRDFADVAWPILKHYRLPATLFVPTAYPDQPAKAFWWDRLHSAWSGTSRSVVTVAPLGAIPLGSATSRRSSQRRVQEYLKSIPHDEAMVLVDRLCHELGHTDADPGAVLSWDELRRLAKDGVTICAHTRTHPALTRIPPDRVRMEVEGSLDDLRREIGHVLPVFSYPFGAHDEAVVRAVRDGGIKAAFTCLDGQNRIPSAEPLRLRRTTITRRTTPFVFRLRLLRSVSYLDQWRHQRNPGAAPRPRTSATVERASSPALEVAYIMSRFPTLTETFVLYEIEAMEAMGASIEIYPLLRTRQRITHPEAVRWIRRAHYHPAISLPILRAQMHYLRRKPATYVGVLIEVLRKTWGSANFFLGALGIFPKVVRFAYEMERRGVAHVHAHFANHPTVAAFVIHRLTGIPFSFTAHGFDLQVERRMLDTKVASAAFAVTISTFNKRLMIAECGPAMEGKIHVIHCGVDTALFSPRSSRAKEAPFRIVCIASFVDVKGHRYLVEACRILRDRGSDFTCDLVGDGPLRRQIETQITRAGLGSRVRLPGGKPRPEIVRLLSEADAAVLASRPTKDGRREGIPVALMEAMARGLPVVASAIGGIPELVESDRTGFLVPPRDPVALADALERLARDPGLRRRMGEAGREKVLREFDLQTNARELLRLFLRGRTGPAVEWAPSSPEGERLIGGNSR